MTDILTWWHAIVLGAIQGLTEFLPVSSSGHLALAEAFLAIDGGGVALAVLLHAGTLLAITLVFPGGIKRLMGGSLRLIGSVGKPPASWHPDAELAAKVAVATVPGGLVGLFLEGAIDAAFGEIRAVGFLLLVTAGFLLATRWAKRGESEVSWRDALLIGCAQALAILPGISRSGATITVAMFCGVARPAAAEFSFLAVVPLIVASLFLRLPELFAGASAAETGSLLAGFVTSFVVGWIALIWFVRLVREGRLHWFALYCVVVGLAGILGPRFVAAGGFRGLGG